MNDEVTTTQRSTADIAPIPLVPVPLVASRQPPMGTGTTFRRFRVWLLAVAAFASVFMVVRTLLAPRDAPPRVEGGQSASAPQSLSPDALFDRSSPAVVQVVVHDRHGRTIGRGSGFLISTSGLIATNYHVIERAHGAHLVLADEAKVPVLGVAAYDEDADIAILKAGGQIVAQPLELAGGDLPSIGTNVYAIGNPLGLANTLSDGLISGHRKLSRLTEIQTTAPISPGSSGGPLLVADGRVVGVTTFLIKGGQNLNFAVPASHVGRLLDHFQIEGRLTSLPLGRQADAVPYLKSGYDSLKAGNFNKAIKDYDEAIRLDPVDADAYVSRGVAFLVSKDYDKAIKDFDEAIRIDPVNASAFDNRGNAWSGKLLHGKAIADYTSAIDLSPNFGAYFHRGNSWMQQKKYDKAVEDYSEAIRLNPSWAVPLEMRALAWHSLGEFDKAIEDCSEAIRLDPTMTDAFYWRGACLAEKRRYSQAIADYSQAIRLEPSKALYYAGRSLAWSKLREFDKANKDRDEAARLDPSYGR